MVYWIFGVIFMAATIVLFVLGVWVKHNESKFRVIELSIAALTLIASIIMVVLAPKPDASNNYNADTVNGVNGPNNGTVIINQGMMSEANEVNLGEPIMELYIGRSKEWVVDQLGNPDFKEDFELVEDEWEASIKCNEYIYIAKDKSFVLRIFFCEDTVVAFFTTIISEKALGKIYIPSPYSFWVGDRPLGNFSYKEIGDVPIAVEGFARYGHWCYFETYFNAMTATAYPNAMVFLSLNYGLDFHQDRDEERFLKDEDINIDNISSYLSNEDFESDSIYEFYTSDQTDDLLKLGIAGLLAVAGDRSINKPNTYGIYKYDAGIIWKVAGFQELDWNAILGLEMPF